MSTGFVTCAVCSKTFVPRFTYQVDQHAGGTPRYYCSQACRMPELRSSSRATTVPAPAPATTAQTVAQANLHSCQQCGQKFLLRYAYQIVTLGKTRHVVCSEACKEKVLAPLKEAETAARAAKQRIPRAIAIMNQKGGTGKTTTSVSIAAGLAERGKSTLLIDLDSQGNVGVSLGVKGGKTLYHVLVDGVRPEDAAVPVRKGLDVITSDQTVAAAELELVSARDRARVLTRRMEAVGGPGSPYDYIVLDCAPSLSLLNQNALTFAGEVVVPVSCDYLALVGVKQILRTLRHVNEVLLHPVDVLGVLPTFYDVRNRISKDAVMALEGYFKDRVLPPIRINAKLKEAPSHKKTIFEYAPDSHGAADYGLVVSWLLTHERQSRSAQAIAAEAAARAMQTSPEEAYAMAVAQAEAHG